MLSSIVSRFNLLFSPAKRTKLIAFFMIFLLLEVPKPFFLYWAFAESSFSDNLLCEGFLAPTLYFSLPSDTSVVCLGPLESCREFPYLFRVNLKLALKLTSNSASFDWIYTDLLNPHSALCLLGLSQFGRLLTFTKHV
jgi:hypothetical protein